MAILKWQLIHQYMNHVIIILVQTDMYLVAHGPPVEWDGSVLKVKDKTTGDFRVGPQRSEGKNQGAVCP